MERIKSTLLLLMITLFVLLSGCNKQPNLSKGQVKKQEIDAAMKTWEEIARSNEKYLEGDGWLELSTVASPAPDARKFYTNLQAWYLLDRKSVV